MTIRDPEAPIRAWLDIVCVIAVLVGAGGFWKASTTPGETAESRAADQEAARLAMEAMSAGQSRPGHATAVSPRAVATPAP